MAVILFGSVYSQTQISGSVMDADSMEAIPGVNVIIDGTNIGTVTDFDGNFVINTSQGAPLTLVVSYVGYSAERVDVTSAGQDINVSALLQVKTLKRLLSLLQGVLKKLLMLLLPLVLFLLGRLKIQLKLLSLQEFLFLCLVFKYNNKLQTLLTLK